MRRLIFVNRFFFPDHSATSQILSDLAFHLAGTGREVHIVTSTQLYDAAQASLPGYEIIDDVRVHRVSSTRFGRSALLGRSIDYLSFYRSAWRCLMQVTRPSDLLVAKTDPPLVSLVAMAAARRKGAILINWLQDLYPEIAVALGVPFIQGPIAASLAVLRNRSLRTAEANVVVGQLMARKIEALGLPSARSAWSELVQRSGNRAADAEGKSLASGLGPRRQIRRRLLGQHGQGARVRNRSRRRRASTRRSFVLFFS